MAETTAEPPTAVPAAAPANDLDEESHYFDFGTFYMKPEFCDRAFQFVILDESKTGGSPPRPAKKGKRAKEKEPEGEEMPVNSIVVAAKSAVLRAMLSNGMKESEKGAPIVIKVTEQEKAAFKEMLQFLYTGTLSPEFSAPATSMSSLVSLLLLGDKYEILSFMGAVLKRIAEQERAVSDSATLVEDLPEVLERRAQIKQLMDDARAHVISTFKDVTGKWGSDEFKGLGLGVLKFLLRSEELEADSEEEIANKVVEWAENKPGALSRLFPFIRFCCIKGEVLEKWVQSYRFAANSNLIARALKILAYSDARKRLEKGLVFCERSGVRKVHLEIVESVRLDEKVTSVSSLPTTWFGKTWYLRVSRQSEIQKEGEPERPPTVGAHLYCGEVVDDPKTEKSLTDRIHLHFYIRTWPDGLWLLKASGVVTYGLEGDSSKGWGFVDALGLPWEAAIKSDKFVGPTGAMVFKVVARRFS